MHLSDVKTSKKQNGWEVLLDNFLEERAEEYFKWGIQDCSTLVVDAIILMVGSDVFDQIGISTKVKYKNKFEAFRTLNDIYGTGFFNTYNIIFDEMGFQEIDEVKYGDIAIVRLENLDQEAAKLFGGLTLVIGFNDSGVVIAPGKEALVLVDQYELVKAWRI